MEDKIVIWDVLENVLVRVIYNYKYIEDGEKEIIKFGNMHVYRCAKIRVRKYYEYVNNEPYIKWIVYVNDEKIDGDILCVEYKGVVVDVDVIKE